jgi:hypothetical protein
MDDTSCNYTEGVLMSEMLGEMALSEPAAHVCDYFDRGAAGGAGGRRELK